MGLLDDLRAVSNDILGVRDAVGAALHSVYIVTRTWSGAAPGDGTPTDVEAQVTPSPGIEDLAHNYKALVGGNYKQGDIRLKHISRGNYATEASVNCASAAENVQKFYKINGQLYAVLKVHEDYISWHVDLRRVSG